MLRYQDLKGLGVPYCRAYVRELVAAGKFPAPLKGINRSIAWRREAVERWLAAKIAEIQASGREPLLPASQTA